MKMNLPSFMVIVLLSLADETFSYRLEREKIQANEQPKRRLETKDHEAFVNPPPDVMNDKATNEYPEKQEAVVDSPPDVMNDKDPHEYPKKQETNEQPKRRLETKDHEAFVNPPPDVMNDKATNEYPEKQEVLCRETIWKETLPRNVIDEPDMKVDSELLEMMTKQGAVIKRGSRLLEKYKWSKTGSIVKVPYKVKEIADAVYVKQAVNEIERVTCVRFVPRNGETDYVEIQSSSSCMSDVGRKGGKELIRLSSGCNKFGKILHEMMHTLGFYHEQNRMDRDNSITVNLNNVRNGFKDQFQKYNSDNQGLPYDCDSILQYPSNYFAKDSSSPTMQGKTPKCRKHLGNGDTRLSVLDVKRVNKLYSCPDKNFQLFAMNVETSWGLSSGTDCFVYMQFVSKGNRSSKKLLVSSGGKRDDFESKRWSYKTDTFEFVMEDQFESDPIKELKIELVDHGLGPQWYPNKVTVTDPRGTSYQFTIKRWIVPGKVDTFYAA